MRYNSQESAFPGFAGRGNILLRPIANHGLVGAPVIAREFIILLEIKVVIDLSLRFFFFFQNSSSRAFIISKSYEEFQASLIKFRLLLSLS